MSIALGDCASTNKSSNKSSVHLAWLMQLAASGTLRSHNPMCGCAPSLLRQRQRHGWHAIPGRLWYSRPVLAWLLCVAQLRRLEARHKAPHKAAVVLFQQCRNLAASLWAAGHAAWRLRACREDSWLLEGCLHGRQGHRLPGSLWGRPECDPVLQPYIGPHLHADQQVNL